MRLILPGARRSIARAATACSYGAGYLLLAALLAALPPGAAAQSSPVSIVADQGSSELTEGETATFTVTRRGDTSQALSVSYETRDGDVAGAIFRADAEAGDDYTATSGTLVFPAGSSQSMQISVPTNTDDEYEPREYFQVRVWGSYSSGGRTVSFEEIVERRIDEAEDRVLTLSPVSTVTSTSGDYPEFTATEGGTNELTISLDNTVPYDYFIQYTVGDTGHRTATKADYTMVEDSRVKIPAGDLSVTIEIDITDDDLVEPVERFTVELISVGNTGGGPVYKRAPFKDSPSSSHEALSVAIEDNDTGQAVHLRGRGNWGSPRFSGLGPQFPTTRRFLDEGQSTVITAVITGAAPSSDIQVPLKFTGYPAGEVDSSDYSIASTVTIKSGKTSGDVTLTVSDDSVDERYRELLVVEVGDTNLPDGYTKGDGSRFEVVMVDNDRTGATLQQLSKTSLSEARGSREATFEVEVERLPRQDAPGDAPFSGVDVKELDPKFNLGYSGRATHNTDYEAPKSVSGKDCATANNKLTCTVTLTVKDDDLYEGGSGATEDVRISLGEGGFHNGFTVTGMPLSITIEDDDLQPMFSITDAPAVTEGGRAGFKITRSSGAKENRISVRAQTAQGGGAPATSDKDYAKSTQTLTLGKNVTETTLEIQTTQDVIDEPDAETFLVKLDNPKDADRLPDPAIAAGTATGTINDDDEAPSALTITVDTDAGAEDNQTTIGEGAGETVVTVTAAITSRTRFAAARTVTVAVGKAGDTAGEGTDYAEVDDFSITIPAEQDSGSATFTLEPVDNDVDAENKTLSVEGALTGMTVTHAAITIEDDDERGITVSADADGLTLDEVDDPDTEDAEHQATYTVALDSQPTATVTVTIDNPDGSPVTLDTSTLEFTTANWNEAQTVTVTAVDDNVDNADDKRSATLAHDVSGGDYGQPEDFDVEVEVADDEGTPTATLALTPASIAESGAGNVSTVSATLSHASAAAVTLTVAVPDGSPVTLSGSALTIAAGRTGSTGTVTLTAVDNDVDAADATVAVSATASGGGVAAPANAALTITDDDDPPDGITLSASPDSVAENAAAAATVTVTATVTGGTTYATDTTVTVSVGANGDGAASGTDYAAVDAFDITVPAGAASATGSFSLDPTDDNVDEEDETLTVAGVSGALDVEGDEITITDDDTATLTIQSAFVNPGSTATLAVILSTPSDRVVTVTATTSDEPLEGTVAATAGEDYTHKSETLTIAAGATRAEFEVVTLPNRGVEFTETFSVTLSGASVGIATGTAYVEILGAREAFVISDASAMEGGDLTFTITRRFARAQAITDGTRSNSVRWTTGDDATDGARKATAGADYTAVTTAQTVTFAANVTVRTITVTSLADALVEGDETFAVTLSNGSLPVLDATGIGTITEGTTGYEVGDAGAAEGEDLSFTITRSGLVSGASSVKWTTGNDTTRDAHQATAGADYTAVTTAQTVSFAAGDTTKTLTVTSLEDTLDEPDETFAVKLATPSNDGVLLDDTGIGTIEDDDDATATVSVEDAAAVAEGDDPAMTTDMTFTVKLSAASGQTVTVPFTLTGTAKVTDDYTAPDPLSVAIAPGATSADIVVPVRGDVLDEPDETVIVTLGTPTHATLSTVAGATTATGTITDDEATPVATLALTPPTIAESGNGNVSTVTARLSGASSAPVTLTVAVPAGAPVTQSGATLTIAAGATGSTGAVTLTAVDNNVDAPDATVAVSATASGGGVADPAAATLTITDDDTAPTDITLTVDADTGTQGTQDSLAEDGGAKMVRVTATITSATRFGAATPVKVKVGKAADTATDGVDYATVADQTLTIAAGAASGHADFTLTPTNDTLDEPDETVSIEGELAEVTVVHTSVILTDDDAPPVLSIRNVLLGDEGDKGVTNLAHRVTLTPASGRTVTVKYADTGTGTATSGEGGDYAALASGTLSFAPGETRKFIRIKAHGDTDYEPDESIIVRLSE
ncbi:MAG: hypothetical protein OXI88_13145, partial [Gammaproteobacteria bacterium]|nr:hypothetical protein [Gammaproteobacteria bacterium]